MSEINFTMLKPKYQNFNLSLNQEKSVSYFLPQIVHFVLKTYINTFYRGLTLIIALLVFPFLYLLNSSGNELVKNFAFMSQSFDFLLMYWCYAQFFNKISKVKTFVLTLYTSLFLSFLNLIIGFILGWIVVAFF